MAEAGILAGDFPFKGKVFEIDSNVPILEATHLLVEKGITSAPVYDADSEKYLGFYDLADGLSLVLGIEKMKGIIPPTKMREQVVSIHGIDVDLSLSENGAGTDIPIKEMMSAHSAGRTQNAPWLPVIPTDCLLTVLNLLATKVEKPWAPCRRVPVVSLVDGKVEKIIAQSAIVTALYDGVIKPGHASEQALFVQTPRSTKIGLTDNVIQAKEDSRIYEVFTLMTDHQISAIPIIGSDNLVVDCITNKDIGTMFEIMKNANSNVKSMTTSEFISYAEQNTQKPRSRTVIVSMDTPIDVILSKLALNKVHRVFISEDDGQLVGVFSVSDAVKAMFENNFPWPRSFMVSKLSPAP